MFKAMFHDKDSDVKLYLRCSKYKYKEKCLGDIKNVMDKYGSLRPKFVDGSKKDLVYLSGTIPVPYK